MIKFGTVTMTIAGEEQCLQPVCSHFRIIFSILHAFPYFTMYSVCIPLSHRSHTDQKKKQTESGGKSYSTMIGTWNMGENWHAQRSWIEVRTLNLWSSGF